MAERVGARVGVIAVAATAAVLGFPAVSGAATTIIVRPGQSIQAAVDAASPGDTILVEPGSYSEPGVACPANPAQTCAVAITKDGISLIGLTRGRRQVVLVNPGGQDVGIQVARTGDPACLSDPARRISGSLVRGVTVSGFGLDGLDVVCADCWRMTRVRAVGDAEYGIFPSLSGPGRVDHSFASGANDTGIYVGQSHNVRVDHNLAAGNNKANTCTPGGDVCNVPPGSGIAIVAADRNRVDHNRVHGNNSFGIIVANLCNAFHLTPAQCAALGIDPNPDGNHIVFNKVTGNGASPDPGIAPLPGADLLWDGTGSGNCWQHNTAGSAFPAELPGC